MNFEWWHGSPRDDLPYLRRGSFVSPDWNIAYQMGRNYNGRVWSDDDLLSPYMFVGAPAFKKQPTGLVYVFQVCTDQVEWLDNNPYEMKLLFDTPISKITGPWRP